jgi:hypothetical protein
MLSLLSTALVISLVLTNRAAASPVVSYSGAASVSDDIWQTAFLTPNATGSAPIEGYTVGSAFPGSKSDNWTFSIQVKDDVPLNGGQFGTGTWVQLSPPDNLLNNTGNRSILTTDPSWGICLSVWLAPVLQSSAAKVDPACGGVLPSDCVADMLRNQQHMGHTYVNSSTTKQACPSISLPTSCMNAFGNDKPPGSEAVGNGEYCCPAACGRKSHTSTVFAN